ncbi:Lrp/AsnC family transcriptional regulator [Devosia lacusdianchii]|uniref:Lrp/AsnC family transcriptional regulator n=1 Tax=Devosia lacusdianchii TaxID=2917991 RepID=UPI001F05EE67|nr:Lrp/AsnC family transcriptional regulator [Devosia sp. JXJ CY 41]
MQEIKLDAFDYAILSALQADASLTNAQIAERVNLSASQCSRRKTALEVAGYIEGYSARLSGTKLGFTVEAFVRVNLSDHGKAQAEDFATYLSAFPQVRAAYSVSGDADYVLHVTAQDLQHFADFIHRHLLPYGRIGQVRSEIVLTTLKQSGGLPLRPEGN